MTSFISLISADFTLKNMVTIDEMRVCGVQEGSRLEITVFKGAANYGYSSMSVDWGQFEQCGARPKLEQAGEVYAGIVYKVGTDSFRQNIIGLSMRSPGNREPPLSFTIDFAERIIHSYALLEPKK